MKYREKTWLFRSEEKHGKALVLIRSPFRLNARKKLTRVADGMGFLTWSVDKLSDEDAAELLKHFKLNEFYLADA